MSALSGILTGDTYINGMAINGTTHHQKISDIYMMVLLSSTIAHKKSQSKMVTSRLFSI